MSLYILLTLAGILLANFFPTFMFYAAIVGIVGSIFGMYRPGQEIGALLWLYPICSSIIIAVFAGIFWLSENVTFSITAT